jgi:hypothetical protein
MNLKITKFFRQIANVISFYFCMEHKRSLLFEFARNISHPTIEGSATNDRPRPIYQVCPKTYPNFF